MNAYSLDLRERVVAAVDAKTPRAEIVRLLRVSLASIRRYLALRRAGQPLAPKPRPGAAPRIGPSQVEALRVQLTAAGPDADLAEHCRRWREAGQGAVSVPTMSRALRAVGWTRKKRASPPANATKKRGAVGAKSTRG